ncbi:hypothetical protein Pmani_032800 [Petrolisthes manimaculis]|uniref:Uncharacterized protein n=1 Tax=Petrolisthes manimaculis TaxID=1843537 RepID=A0AAE1NT43_9EUCA|nr:hypothetical protein Pmani_032800 [Petrolisthes manimaculis]
MRMRRRSRGETSRTLDYLEFTWAENKLQCPGNQPRAMRPGQSESKREEESINQSASSTPSVPTTAHHSTKYFRAGLAEAFYLFSTYHIAPIS